MSKTKGSAELVMQATKRATRNKSGFTLYGLPTPVDFDATLRVSDHISAVAPKVRRPPGEAANKYYDKSVS